MKNLKKIFMCLLTMIMVLGTCVMVNAADTKTAVDSIKAAKTVTVYTNDKGNCDVTVKLTWTTAKGDYVAPTVKSSDKGIVTVSGFTASGETTVSGKKSIQEGTITLTPVANGKATVTVTDPLNAKRTAKIKVVVKTYAESIACSNVSEEGKLVVAKNGTLNLGAAVTNSEASDQKLTYAVKEGSGIKVDKSGNVTLKTSKKVTEPGGTITITSKDKKATKEVAVICAEPLATKIAFVQDNTSSKAVLGEVNKKNVLTLKGNTSSAYHSYVMAVADKSVKNSQSVIDASDLVFTSSNSAVVKTSGNKLVAAGNGKATVTAYSRLNSKVAAKLTVNVTTDVESVTVSSNEVTLLANNKDSVNLGAATNKDASNRKITYSVASVEVNGKPAEGKTSNYITVSSKGVVKAKKSCDAVVIATAAETAKNETPICQAVKVTANNPVNKVKITADGSANMYIMEGGESTYCRLYADVTAKDGEPTDGSVTWTSNKYTVATVDEDGNITAVGNGKAVITAKANDNSGKKATFTVNVKTDAYEIKSAKADADNTVYVVGTEKAKSYKTASVIAAATNADASNKKVSYSQSSVSLKAGDDAAEITVTAKDPRNHGDKESDPDYATETFNIVCVAAADVAAAEDYYVEMDDASDIDLYQGAKATVSATAGVTGGKTALDLSNITFVSDNTKVATVTKAGVITAKKPGTAGIYAKLTYTYYDEKGKAKTGVAESEKINVYVGRTQAAIVTELNTAFKNALNSENFTYLGVKQPVFDTKTNKLTVDITNPNAEIGSFKNTNIVNLLSNVALNASVKFTDMYAFMGDGKQLHIIKNGEKYTAEIIEENADGAVTVEAEGLTESGLIDYLKENVSVGDTLMDLAGKNMLVWFNCTDDASGKAIEYTDITYEIEFTMAESVFKEAADAEISSFVSEVSAAGITDIDSLEYNAAANTAVMTAANADTSAYDAAAAAKDSIVNTALGHTLLADSVSGIKASATVDGKNFFVEKQKADSETAESFLNGFVDSYVDQLSGKTYGDFDGAATIITVSYKVGNLSFTEDYKLVFGLSDAAFEGKAEEQIVKLVDKVSAMGTAAYDRESNTASIKFNSTYAALSPEEAGQGTGLYTALTEMIAEDGVTGVSVSVDGQTPTTIDVQNMTAANVLAAVVGDSKTLAEMDQKTAVVKVTYTLGTSSRTITYMVKFAADPVETPETETETPVEGQTVTEPENTEVPAEESTEAEEGTETETPVEESTETEVPVESTEIEEVTETEVPAEE